jgi:NADH-quinone oxidoreductase subunit C
MAITKVWIEEGCIVCNACEAECPDVFHVTADSCHIKGEARVDGAQDENRDGKSPLKADLQKSLEFSIVSAAAGCPVSVIHYEQVANAPEPEAPKAEAPAAPAPAPEPVKAPEPVAAAPAPTAPKPAEPAKAEGPRITKVWIEEGCIVCNACEAECGEVFHVTAGSCHIKADSRVDGKEDENRAAKSPVKGDMGAELYAKIVAAAAGCPVNVIKYEGTGVAAAPAAEAKAEAASGPYVWDMKAAPNRQVTMPKTAPLPSLKAYLAEVNAQFQADEAKWQKTLADYEVAKKKAAEEGKPEPKAPVRPGPKKDDNDVVTPFPQEAKDADLLFLAAQLGDKVEEVFEQAGELTCQVKKEALLEVLHLLKDRPELKYEMLADQTATHYPAAKDFAFSIVYHLTSLSRRKRLRLRILVNEGDVVASAVPVYPSANWMEREIFDMFGIRFDGHPDLTRILCPEDWEGYPLRKEYPTLGLGQRDIDFREDRSGMLMRIAMEKAGNLGINLKVPKAE